MQCDVLPLSKTTFSNLECGTGIFRGDATASPYCPKFSQQKRNSQTAVWCVDLRHANHHLFFIKHYRESKWLLLSTQVNFHKDFRLELEEISQNMANTLVLDVCSWNESAMDKRCHGHSIYNYPDIMQVVHWLELVRSFPVGLKTLEILRPCSLVGHVPTLPWVRRRAWVRVGLGSGLASGKGSVGTWPVTRLDPKIVAKWQICPPECHLSWLMGKALLDD